MAPGTRNLLIVNVLFWFVGAAIHPVARLFPAASGEVPKFYSFLIPLLFVALAFGSTVMMARAAARPS